MLYGEGMLPPGDRAAAAAAAQDVGPVACIPGGAGLKLGFWWCRSVPGVDDGVGLLPSPRLEEKF